MNILIQNDKNKHLPDESNKNMVGKNTNNQQIESLIKIFINYMNNDKETEQLIRTIKELF